MQVDALSKYKKAKECDTPFPCFLFCCHTDEEKRGKMKKEHGDHEGPTWCRTKKNGKKVVSWEDEKKNGHNLYKISFTAYQQKPLNRNNQKRHYIITR